MKQKYTEKRGEAGFDRRNGEEVPKPAKREGTLEEDGVDKCV